MTRKFPWGLLLCFAHLTILPGCQGLPYFSKSATDHPNPADDRQADKAHLLEEPENQLIRTPVLPDEPGLTKEPLKVVPVKRPSEGLSGIVELEPPPPKLVTFPTATPLPQPSEPKSEFEPIVLALQRMLEGRHQDAIKHLGAYDNDKQELFLRLVPIIETFVKKRIDELSGSEVAVLLKQLDSVKDTLRPRSELVVSRMCYCKEVKGFGSLVVLPDQHQFLSGTAQRIGEQVKLYVELKNFSSEPTKDGTFLTKLSCALELRDADKKVVMSKRLDGNETTLRRSSRLNDLYSLYGFYVPALPAGTYQLTLHIADETNPKAVRVASRSLEFRVTPVAKQPALR